MRRVAADEKDARTVFIRPVAEGFRLTAFTPEGQRESAAEDREAATAVLIHERLATPNEEVGFEVGGEMGRVALPSSSIELGPPYPIRSDTGLRDYIEERNRSVLRRLEKQLRSPLGVIPFVGAGMSKP